MRWLIAGCLLLLHSSLSFSFHPHQTHLIYGTSNQRFNNDLMSLHAKSTLKNRRNVLANSAAAVLLSTTTSIITQQQVAQAAPETTGEAVRKAASNIPGYGPPDVYFPSKSFQGRWKATRTMISCGEPYCSSLNIPFPVEIEYEIRFIPVDTPGQCVADRNFNEASFYNALRNKVSSSSTLPNIQSTQWSQNNPNVLTISYVNGSNNEIKVTKRASQQYDDDAVSSSEYRRVITVDQGNGGIPQISATRKLEKWKVSGEGEGIVLEAIELIYSEGRITDPMSYNSGKVMQQPQQQEVVGKSRLKLVKIKDE